jgi:copper chaperone CopZ
MKKMIMIILVMWVSMQSHAQFSRAYLQATGLTCAMCSNAINKALLKVPFVESVKPDIKNSAFDIVFKKDSRVEIDALKKAVDDAGFSVGSLKVTGSFNDLKIANDEHVKIGPDNFHFLDVKDQVLSGEKTITLVDRDFVSAKQFKRYSAATKMKCIQTGKAESCCVKDGVPANARIYHVTI